MEKIDAARKAAGERRADRKSRQVVYFIRAGQRIKIGTSIVPQRRLEAIRCGTSKRPLGLDTSRARIIATMPGDNALESELHGKFSHIREVGEWFRATPELVDYIKEVAA